NDDNAQCALISFTPAGAVTVYPVLLGPGGYIANLTLGPDGNFWMPEGIEKIGADSRVDDYIEMTPAGAETVLPLPDSLSAILSVREGANPALGPDGNIWLDDLSLNTNSLVFMQLQFGAQGAAQFAVSSDNPTPELGSPFNVTVRALDSQGLQDAGYRGTVHF